MRTEYKAIPLGDLQVVDDERGVVEALVSVTGIWDEVDDLIEPGAYQKTLAKRVPKGVWGHDWNTPVSKTLEARELMPGDPELPTFDRNGKPWPREAGALKVKTQFNLETTRGREAYSDVKFFGTEAAWSVGYQVPVGKATMEAKGVGGKQGRRIKEMELYEYSPVLHGAMPLAATTSVKAAQSALLAVKSAMDAAGVAAAAETKDVSTASGPPKATRGFGSSERVGDNPHKFEFDPDHPRTCKVCGKVRSAHEATKADLAATDLEVKDAGDDDDRYATREAILQMVADEDLDDAALLDLGFDADGVKAMHDAASLLIEEKAVIRHVRTTDGARKYGQPIGTAIVPGVSAPNVGSLGRGRAVYKNERRRVGLPPRSVALKPSEVQPGDRLVYELSHGEKLSFPPAGGLGEPVTVESVEFGRIGDSGDLEVTGDPDDGAILHFAGGGSQWTSSTAELVTDPDGMAPNPPSPSGEHLRASAFGGAAVEVGDGLYETVRYSKTEDDAVAAVNRSLAPHGQRVKPGSTSWQLHPSGDSSTLRFQTEGTSGDDAAPLRRTMADVPTYENTPDVERDEDGPTATYTGRSSVDESVVYTITEHPGGASWTVNDADGGVAAEGTVDGAYGDAKVAVEEALAELPHPDAEDEDRMAAQAAMLQGAASAPSAVAWVDRPDMVATQTADVGTLALSVMPSDDVDGGYGWLVQDRDDDDETYAEGHADTAEEARRQAEDATAELLETMAADEAQAVAELAAESGVPGDEAGLDGADWPDDDYSGSGPGPVTPERAVASLSSAAMHLDASLGQGPGPAAFAAAMRSMDDAEVHIPSEDRDEYELLYDWLVALRVGNTSQGELGDLIDELNDLAKSIQMRSGGVKAYQAVLDTAYVTDVETKVSSRAYPSLERHPGKQNWVDEAGGLPSYIERIAKHLHYEKGMTIGHAIATAVNQVKKWASGVGDVNPDTRAKAAKAVAEWEAKKAKARAKKDALAVDTENGDAVVDALQAKLGRTISEDKADRLRLAVKDLHEALAEASLEEGLDEDDVAELLARHAELRAALTEP